MEGKKRVIALGFFDGIHIGHAALMRKVSDIAKETGLMPAVITFDTHPLNMISGKSIPIINSADDRAGLISRMFNIEDVIFLHFDANTMKMRWDEFIKRLVSDFNAAHLVAGHDYRFGYKGEGDTEKLKKLCAELGLGCDIIPAVVRDGITISSTHIRELIASGEIEKANEFLGHPHVLTDTVRRGYQFGRTLGAPTVNMRFDEGVLVPLHGVYAAKVYLDDGCKFTAVTNIGTRPTVGNSNVATVESYILGFDGNLYGRQIRVEFFSLLRPEKRFSSIEKLKEQILIDAVAAKEYFDNYKP